MRKIFASLTYSRLQTFTFVLILSATSPFTYGQISACTETDYPCQVIVYTEAIKKDPKDAEAYAKRGIAFKKEGKYSQSIDDLTKAIEINPGKYNYYFERAVSYRLLRNFDLAISDYTKTIELRPDHATAYNHRGVAHYLKKNFDLALANYNKAISLDPKFASAFYNRGLWYHDKDKHELALSDYSKSIELDPKFSDAYVNRGTVYLFKKQLEPALQDFSKALELAPWDSKIYYNRGRGYLLQGQFEKAISDLIVLLKADPKDGRARFIRAAAYQNMGNFDFAIADYLAITKLFKSSESISTVHIALAFARIGCGKSNEAHTDILSLLETKTLKNDSLAYVILAGYFSLLQMDKSDEAMAFLEQRAPKMAVPVWEFRLIDFVRGKITDKQLLASAQGRQKIAIARAIIGLEQSMRDDRIAALENLLWVSLNSDKDLLPYMIANNEIRRIRAKSGK